MAFTDMLYRFAMCMYQELKGVNGWKVTVWSIMTKVH